MRTALLVAAVVLSGLGLAAPPAAAQSAPVIPTQWIAKQFTEGLGRAPTPAEWNTWVGYYTTNGCSTTTLREMTRSTFTSADFAARYPAGDHAGRIIALVRAAYSHEPNSNDWAALYPPLANGTRTWAATVDQVFLWVFDPWVRPSVCDASNAGYGFDAAVPLDVKSQIGAGASRTQATLQSQLDAAKPGCGTVSLAPYETVRIGAPGSPASVTVPACVTLTTTGAPASTAYARQGRLVADAATANATCAAVCPTELVTLADGATLRNVWVSGGAAANALTKIPQALVGVRSGTAVTRVIDTRLSDPLANGTALELQGYGTSTPGAEVECAGREAATNLVTGYASRAEQTRMGQARWVDGIAVHCEQANVHHNGVVDVSDVGIGVYGVWNAKVGNKTDINTATNPWTLIRYDGRRTQRSTVTANTVLSAGLSAQVAIAADAAGKCLAEDTGAPIACLEFAHDRPTTPGQPAPPEGQAMRNFSGTVISANTFWTGARTHFKIGLMIGSWPLWGQNAPPGTGINVTSNTTGGITTRVQTGILVSGMVDVLLTGNTATYEDANRSPGITENTCRVGDVVSGYYRSWFRAGSQATTVDVFENRTCLTLPRPTGGFEPIVVSGNRFTGQVSGTPFVSWGLSQNLTVDGAGLETVRTIRQLGMNTVRAHLMFTDVMQSCTQAKPSALAEVQVLVRRLEETGLYVQLVGLSSWLGDQGDRDAGFGCYADGTEAQRWAAQGAFWSAVAGAVAGSPAVLGLDLMNEPMVADGAACWLPKASAPGVDPCSPVGPNDMATYSQRISKSLNGRTTAQVGQAWVAQMAQAIRSTNTGHAITLGCFPWTTCAGMTPTQQAATAVDYLSPHFYPQDCSKKGSNWLTGTETDNAYLDRCTFIGSGNGEANAEFIGSVTRTKDDGTTITYTYTGSGDGITYELDQLTQWAAPGLPVVIGEVGNHTGGDVWRLMRTTMLDGRTDGWLAIFGDGLTLSQQRAPGGFAGTYYNARMMQRVGQEVAPCGNCGP